MATTLFLRPDTWDFALDASGNIAVATDVYQQAQDVASACRTFTGDLYYDSTAGIPYSEEILGVTGFPLALYKMYLEDSALSIGGVVSAQALIGTSDRRTVVGAITFTNDENQTGQLIL